MAKKGVILVSFGYDDYVVPGTPAQAGQLLSLLSGACQVRSDHGYPSPRYTLKEEADISVSFLPASRLNAPEGDSEVELFLKDLLERAENMTEQEVDDLVRRARDLGDYIAKIKPKEYEHENSIHPSTIQKGLANGNPKL